MARKNFNLRDSRRAHNRKDDDVSDHTLMLMVILVLVVSVLSVAMYIYAFYGGSTYTKIQKSSSSSIIEEKPVASGMASIEIIEPPENSK